ncbi:GspH/FimT family pseudopilin [Stenotrophomonas sp. NLF4-10]|uniref:GspH/FimT family pseudopilin n=1 Tax=Stenotrophomonas sp. NLF4-10 TaxID=2918754 RepID=UPI001EFC0D67|nr:GspH/FimT family pseudopilin [Stenotrophomonas sp. NLF4-10]MCG8276169.1 GspH/FimT family pseudopilin [Stenotrophomonas sp. NLF4-10]
MARMPTTPPNRHAGITLVEVIVCACVLSITAAIAAPSMANLVERQRATAANHSLITHLAQARMTAITRRVPVILCPSHSGSTCNADTNWGDGWLLFLDRDGNRQPDHPNDIVLVDNAPISSHMKLTSTAGRKHVRYLPDGRSPGTNLTISICNKKGELLTAVVVNNTGRARSTRPRTPTTCPN